MTYRMHQIRFDAIGTGWIVDVSGKPPALLSDSLESAVRRRIEIFDKRFSRFRDDSMVADMARHAGAYQIEQSERPLIELYRTLYDLTGGLFTPLIGQALSDAGYDADYSLKSKSQIAHTDRWEDVIHIQGEMITLKKPALLDFGAAGKGFIIDEVASMLKSYGVDGYCVDAGGDMVYYSAAGKPLRVGLENPCNTKQVIGVAAVSNASICGSSGNKRNWGPHHHIMNPFTHSSPDRIAAVWTIADSAMVADALATSLFFVNPEILHRFNFEYLIVRSDFTVEKSSRFPAELYYN